MSPANTAVEGLYQAHASELHAFARRRLGRQEAEDVVQDTYLHLLQRGTAATLEHPRPYLFRIAANLAVDFARKAKVRLRYEAGGPEFVGNAETLSGLKTSATEVIELRLIEAALGELPGPCREAFLLGRVEELSHAEIAGRLGVSVRTIDRYVAKALAHLRKKFGRGQAT